MEVPPVVDPPEASADVPPAEPAPSRGGWRRAGLLAAELFVVFAGVSMAFLLDGWRERQRDDERREQIREVLLADLETTFARLASLDAFFDSTYAAGFLEPYDEGERPSVQPIWLSTNQLSGTWDAVLQSGGLGVLDPAFVQAVEQQQASVRFLVQQTDRAVRQSDAQIVPALADDAFYIGDRLRPQFAWYGYTLYWLGVDIEQAQAATDSLAARLRQSGA